MEDVGEKPWITAGLRSTGFLHKKRAGARRPAPPWLDVVPDVTVWLSGNSLLWPTNALTSRADVEEFVRDSEREHAAAGAELVDALDVGVDLGF